MLLPGIAFVTHLPTLLRRGYLHARPLGRRAAAGVSRLPLLQLLANVAEAHTVVLDAELLVQHLALRTRRQGHGFDPRSHPAYVGLCRNALAVIALASTTPRA